jgi:endonuclease-3
MAKEPITQKRQRADAIFARLSQSNPHPVTELEYTNHYTLLVAVVLSAQSTDAGVNRATRSLFAKVQTPEAMIALGLDGLKAHIKTIGLYNSKAQNIIALSEALIRDHQSQVPDRREALMKLPGVGRKTANVILNCAFGEPTMAVDTHVFRLAHRLQFSTGKTPEAVEDDLLKLIPTRWMQHAHHWLILHGRYQCTARNPRCTICVIKEHCPSAATHG